MKRTDLGGAKSGSFEVWHFNRAYMQHILLLSFLWLAGLVFWSWTMTVPLVALPMIIYMRVVAHRASSWEKVQGAWWITSSGCFAMILCFRLLIIYERWRSDTPSLEQWLFWQCQDGVNVAVWALLATTLAMPRWQFGVFFVLNVPAVLRTSMVLKPMLMQHALACDSPGFAADVAPARVMASLWSVFATLLAAASWYTIDQLNRACFRTMCEHEAAHERERQSERRALQVERRAQEEKVQLRDQYLGTISHDLGTPIAALRVVINLLTARVEPSGELGELLLSLSSALELLSVVRAKAVSYSKLQRGLKLKPHVTSFDVAVVIAKARSITDVMSKGNRNRVSYSIDASVPSRITADEGWLFMILMNLVMNAFKHAVGDEEGQVSVTLRRSREAELRIEVADNGPGVPIEFEPHLFKPFSTMAKSWMDGTGLGLYHVDQLAQASGGRAAYEPNVPTGATFYVLLPLDRREGGAKDQSNAREQQTEGVVSLSSLLRLGRSLVVDDSPMMRLAMRLQLEHWGASDAIEAESGQAAVKTVMQASAEEMPAWIFMDALMPCKNGFETTRELREWEKLSRAPDLHRLRIVGLSANGHEERCVADALAAGMDAMLCKPLDKETLLRTLIQTVEMHSSAPTRRDTPAPSSSPADSRSNPAANVEPSRTSDSIIIHGAGAST